jgi:hypothetical protein
VHAHVVSLDELPFVLGVACREGALTLAVQGAGGEAAAAGWAEGSLLVGGAQWGCKGSGGGGAPAPFYLRVRAPAAVLARRGGGRGWGGSCFGGDARAALWAAILGHDTQRASFF